MRNRWILTLLAGLAFAGAGAQSLWTDSTGSIFADRKARKVGDVVAIIVTESASANARAATKTTKNEDSSTSAGLGPILKDVFKAWSLSGETNSDASGSTNRSDNLSTRISVTIKEVLPNGNLLLEGARVVTINKEARKVILTGVVRPDDIRPDNTIPSTVVADAKITYDGKGAIGDKQRKGIITRIFEFLF